MCGIAGLAWKNADRSSPIEEVKTMCEHLAHRGPDDHGLYSHNQLTLGHRRLSILDLSPSGHQPMISFNKRYALTFNGEIYNYQDLRSELIALGHQFRGESDTEVLLAAFSEWSHRCVDHLDGMWAFAVYDRNDRKIFLSRDRFGIKPLHYINSPECLAFSSEVKALLAALPGYRNAYRSMLDRFFVEGRDCDPDKTFFENVNTLPAAHNAVYDINRHHLKTWSYWDIDSNPSNEPQTAKSAQIELRALLESSVSLQMQADVPVGTCLSGGIDSSAIVGMMSTMHSDSIHTYSGRYSEPNYDESMYMDLVNQKWGTKFHSVRPHPSGDLLKHLSQITWHQDMPTGGPGLYTQFHVMARANKDVKVILDGQGADEIFAGYLYYFVHHLLDLLDTKKPGNLIKALGLVINIARIWGPSYVDLSQNSVRNIILKILRLFKGTNRALTMANNSPASSGHIDKCSRLSKVLYQDVRMTSLPALLHYEDRNSMAYSLEARVPFLDHKIVELAFKLPDNLKIHGSWTKWILRRSVEDLLPKEVAWRRSKLGYPTPFSHWIRAEPDRTQISDLLFGESLRHRDIISESHLTKIWHEHQEGSLDHGWMLWRIITTELWFQHFIDSWSPCYAQSE